MRAYRVRRRASPPHLGVHFSAIYRGHLSAGESGIELVSDAQFLTGCACEDCCVPDDCACCREVSGKHGPGAYTSTGLLQVEPGTPIYECGAACRCPPTCRNRVVQRGAAVSLQVYKTKHKGWAVRALGHISRGAFVCEYTGEVITTGEAERRGNAQPRPTSAPPTQRRPIRPSPHHARYTHRVFAGERYDEEGFSTLFDLDAAGGENEFTIDATYRCGVARFLNHSCEPNLAQSPVWVDNVSTMLPRIAFFALRHIEPYEELTFDYKYQEGARRIECHCGAPSCRKWLY